MFDVGHNINAYAISFLRIIHLAPGLEFRRYLIPKSVVTLLGVLTNQNTSALELRDRLEALNLKVKGTT